MNVLHDAVQLLKSQKNLQGWCQRFCDRALTKVSPRHSLPDASTALRSLALMKKDPSRYGFKRVHSLDGQPYTLVYFERCGGHPSFAEDEWCGHVGIYCRADGKIYSSTDYRLNQWWLDRRAGYFVPV